jgi:DNA-binding PadR family transcriptional regulator
MRSEQKLRWIQIVNELLCKLPCKEEFRRSMKNLSNRENQKAFGVKVTRALKRLVRDGLMQQTVEGHKNVSYSVTDFGKEELSRICREKYDPVFQGSVFAGVYRPGCSLREFRAEAIRQWMDYFEVYHWPELKKVWQAENRLNVGNE